MTPFLPAQFQLCDPADGIPAAFAPHVTLDRDLGIMPAHDYDTLPSYSITGKGPHSRQRRIDAKHSQVFRLRNVYVGSRGVIFTESGHIFSRHTAPFDHEIKANPQNFGYVMDPYGFKWAAAAKAFVPLFQPETVRVIDGPVFLASSYWEQAYTHFLIEVLPCLEIWQAHYPDLPILLSTSVRQARAELLSVMGLDENHLALKDQDEVVFVKELVVADFPRFTAPETANFLHQVIGRHFPAPAVLTDPPIYLARHDEYAWDRYTLNEPEVIAMLQRHGFRTFVPSSVGFREQMETLMRAPLIVGQYGGAIFNLMLGLKGKNVILLSSEDYLRFQFDAMNPFLHHDARRLICRSFTARRDPNNSPIFVDVAALEQLVQGYLASHGSEPKSRAW